MAALAAAVAAMAGGVARADSRVGVVVASRAGMSERDADGLASLLGRALAAQLEVEVVAGVDARRRLSPGGIARDCAWDPDCQLDVARRLGGDELLVLDIARAGHRVTLGITWCDPDIGMVADRDVLSLPEAAGAEADRMLAAAASRLLPHASPRVGATGSLVMSRSPPAPRRFTGPALAAGAVAVVALGAGIGFATAARADYNELEQDGCARATCAAARRRVDQMERRALTADILFGTAAAAAITGAILYLTSGGESESRWSAGAMPGRGGALLSFGVIF
jgi:hypothetical protein